MSGINVLPRHLPGAPPSARVHNACVDEANALALSLTLTRSTATALPANTDQVIQWQGVSGGIGAVTGGKAMWSSAQPQFATIRQPGTYLMLLQVRFQRPGDTNRVWARILVNGTAASVNTVVSDSRTGATVAYEAPGDNGKVIVQAFAVRPLEPGDTVWGGVRTNESLGTSYGIPGGSIGTSLSLVRLGPSVGPLSGNLGASLQGLPGASRRVESRSLPSEALFNDVALAIDQLGIVCKPRRTSPGPYLAANTLTFVAWQDNVVDTRGDMWDPADPAKVTIRVSGQYLIEARANFPVTGGSASGLRQVMIYKNANVTLQSAGTFPLAIDARPATLANEGTTCLTRTVARLQPGDVLSVAVHSTVALSSLAGTAGGGTYLFVTRIGLGGNSGAVIQGQSFDTDPIPDALRADTVAGRPA